MRDLRLHRIEARSYVERIPYAHGIETLSLVVTR